MILVPNKKDKRVSAKSKSKKRPNKNDIEPEDFVPKAFKKAKKNDDTNLNEKDTKKRRKKKTK